MAKARKMHGTTEVSDRRREERRSARGTRELPPGVGRRSGAAVRLHRLVAFLDFSSIIPMRAERNVTG
jgi:hypothetical protein